MTRLSWLGSKHTASGSSQSLNSLDEIQQLEDAIRGAEFIMNDDLDAAEAALSKDNSPFHKLGKGAASFLRATLGFEQDMMKEASERLVDAETSAYERQQRAQHEPKAFQSAIYPTGSEFILVQAQAQILNAVVGVLNESVTEALRGFYKMRKAYASLQVILDAEQRYCDSRVGEPLHVEASQPVDEIKTQDAPSMEPNVTPSEHGVDEFFDATLSPGSTETTEKYLGHLNTDDDGQQTIGISDQKSLKSTTHTEDALDPTIFTNTIDGFIHSGASLCTGMLLLMLSLIPPAFSKILSILGFKGDRDRGLMLLWRATRFKDMSGGIAGLVILGYYNNILNFCDIVPHNYYPRDRCAALMQEMRQRYPGGRLWVLEQAKVKGGELKLEEAIEMLSGENSTPSPLKQVHAILTFQASLDMLFLHRYEDAAQSFVKVVELNNWSHGMYYYIAGSCHVELYRALKLHLTTSGGTNITSVESSDLIEKLNKHATEAEDLFKKAQTASTAKKRFFARRLPFDVFIDRKVTKWLTRAKARGCDLVDAVGVGPVEEMIYFWGGYRKMRPEHLQHSLERLDFRVQSSGDRAEERDECGIRAVLQACVHRHLGDTTIARDVLDKDIVLCDPSEFKGLNCDSWVAPVGNYEYAVCRWVESRAGLGPHEDIDQEKLKSCARLLDKVAKWESYDLEARMGIRIAMGKTTLRKLGFMS